MGNCVTQEVPLLVSSRQVEQIAEENLFLLSALLRYFIEKKEYGAALKLMRMKDSTSEHYSTTKEEKRKLAEIEERLEEADRQEIRALLAQELQQVRQANFVLKEHFKEFKDARWFFSHKELENYVSKFDSNPANKETYKYLEREYLSSLKNNEFFEDSVLKVNFGQDIPPRYQKAIKHICSYTTHIFCSKTKQVSYSQYIPGLRISRKGTNCLR